MGVVTVRALGGLEVFIDGRRATPSAPKPRQILALLALRRSECVSVDALIDELWGERPPRGALAALQTHVYELRKDLRAARADRLLITRSHGYTMDLPPRHLDVTRFDQHVATGAAALAADDPAAARRHLTAALRLFAGRPLAGVRCGGPLSGHVVHLEESRLRATELKIDADLRLGRHDDVIGDLRVAVAHNPYHEGLVLKLMTALSGRGRRAEALAVYQSLHDRLIDELGVEPSAAVRRVRDALMGRAGPAVAVSSPAGSAPMPSDITEFIGRTAVLRRARASLLGRAAGGVLTITGLPGVGKTATAVHLAHAVRERFPGGLVFVDGSGAGRDPVETVRSWCERRRVLLVVDDVADAGAVAMLKPDNGCAVIVTSRSARGLTGAQVLTLQPLDTDEGVALLSRLVRDGRVDAEPAAAKGLVDAVDGLPLAVDQVARWVRGAPGRRLDACHATLIDALDRQPLSRVAPIAAVYDGLHHSYLSLSAGEQHTFRLLCLMRSGDFTTDEAAKTLRTDLISAEASLSRLCETHLVRSLGDAWWSVPSLLRRLSLECLTELSSGSGPACTDPRPPRPGRRPAPWSARSA